VKQTFYTILPVYALTGGLAFLSLNLMKRFTGGCILAPYLVRRRGYSDDLRRPVELARARPYRGRDYVSLSRDYGEPHAFAPSFSGAGNFYDIGFTKSI